MKNRNDNQKPIARPLKNWVIGLGIFCAILLAANIWTLAVYAPSRQNLAIEEKKNQYPLIDIVRNFIPQEHFITNIEPLRQELRELVAKEGPTSISLYFEYLNTGANIQVNPDLNIWPASLAKLPLAMVVMKKVEDGVWALDNELVLMEQDKEMHSGTLYKNAVGTRFTIEVLLKELLNNSDNTAYKMLLRNTTTDELAGVVNVVGLEELFTPDGRVSAKEYSRLLRALYTSSYLKREGSQKILQWLSDASFREYLSSGLPGNIVFAHKFGKNDQFFAFADAGVAYIPNRPYLLTVMIQGKGNAAEDEVRAKELMKIISKKVYEYVANY